MPQTICPYCYKPLPDALFELWRDVIRDNPAEAQRGFTTAHACGAFITVKPDGRAVLTRAPRRRLPGVKYWTDNF